MLGGVAFASIWSGALDARPRRWRLRSSVALDAAALVELAALPAFPQYFVPIAGLANVAKNISYLAASASRAAIHRALSNRQGAANLGDLTAKSGSQTIVASLVGLGLGVGVSNACGGDVTTVWPAWAALSATHLNLYVAVATLRGRRRARPSKISCFGGCVPGNGHLPDAGRDVVRRVAVRGRRRPFLVIRGRPRRCFPIRCVWWGAPYVLHTKRDVARLLLYDDAAPRDALEAAVHARARSGLPWTRAPPRPSRRPWRTRAGGWTSCPSRSTGAGRARRRREVKDILCCMFGDFRGDGVWVMLTVATAVVSMGPPRPEPAPRM